MKPFNPNEWTKAKVNKFQPAPQRLRINATERTALWVRCDGKETIAGFSDTFDLALPFGSEFKVMAEAYFHNPGAAHEPIKTKEPPLTNFEKRPELSSAEIAVTRAMRQMQKQRAQERAQWIAETKRLRAEMAEEIPPLDTGDDTPPPADPLADPPNDDDDDDT